MESPGEGCGIFLLVIILVILLTVLWGYVAIHFFTEYW